MVIKHATSNDVTPVRMGPQLFVYDNYYCQLTWQKGLHMTDWASRSGEQWFVYNMALRTPETVHPLLCSYWSLCFGLVGGLFDLLAVLCWGIDERTQVSVIIIAQQFQSKFFFVAYCSSMWAMELALERDMCQRFVWLFPQPTWDVHCTSSFVLSLPMPHMSLVRPDNNRQILGWSGPLKECESDESHMWWLLCIVIQTLSSPWHSSTSANNMHTKMQRTAKSSWNCF